MNAVDKKLLSNKCTLGDGGVGWFPSPLPAGLLLRAGLAQTGF